MAYVYRYKDMWTNEIHYVGIVWSKTRTLSTRISEHYKNDDETYLAFFSFYRKKHNVRESGGISLRPYFIHRVPRFYM